jgi:serine O-acetyltransferase
VRCTMAASCQIVQQVTIGGNATSIGVPVVGDNVYLGAGAKILGQVKIGPDSIVGANAVVVHDVPQGTIVAGVPARVLRNRPSGDPRSHPKP